MYSYTDVFVKLILSLFFGGIVGYEREAHGRAAGLRTHILVSVGSCLIMLTSTYIYEVYKNVTVIDPSRIAAGVVTGIGFLGAGTILRFRGSVIGLTTAASIWAVAAVGLATGLGFYEGAIVTTALILATLILVSRMEYRFIRKDWYKRLIIISEIQGAKLQKIRNVLAKYNAEIKDFEVEKLADKNESSLRFDIKLTSNKYDDTIIMTILEIEGISKARWE